MTTKIKLHTMTAEERKDYQLAWAIDFAEITKKRINCDNYIAASFAIARFDVDELELVHILQMRSIERQRQAALN